MSCCSAFECVSECLYCCHFCLLVYLFVVFVWPFGVGHICCLLHSSMMHCGRFVLKSFCMLNNRRVFFVLRYVLLMPIYIYNNISLTLNSNSTIFQIHVFLPSHTSVVLSIWFNSYSRAQILTGLCLCFSADLKNQGCVSDYFWCYFSEWHNISEGKMLVGCLFWCVRNLGEILHLIVHLWLSVAVKEVDGSYIEYIIFIGPSLWVIVLFAYSMFVFVLQEMWI